MVLTALKALKALTAGSGGSSFGEGVPIRAGAVTSGGPSGCRSFGEARRAGCRASSHSTIETFNGYVSFLDHRQLPAGRGGGEVVSRCGIAGQKAATALGETARRRSVMGLAEQMLNH